MSLRSRVVELILVNDRSTFFSANTVRAVRREENTEEHSQSKLGPFFTKKIVYGRVEFLQSIHEDMINGSTARKLPSNLLQLQYLHGSPFRDHLITASLKRVAIVVGSPCKDALSVII